MGFGRLEEGQVGWPGYYILGWGELSKSIRNMEKGECFPRRETVKAQKCLFFKGTARYLYQSTRRREKKMEKMLTDSPKQPCRPV